MKRDAKKLSDAVENPFSERNAGFVCVHVGHLIIRGEKGSQKDGFTMKRFCALVFDNEKRAGYMFCFKTKSCWQLFEKCFWNLFFDDKKIDWNLIKRDDKLDEIIALKDAHVDNSELPPHKRETFIKQANEIFIYRTKSVLNKTLTSDSLNGHYLILNEDDYFEWIGHIQKMAIVEKKAIKFREKQKQKKTLATIQQKCDEHHQKQNENQHQKQKILHSKIKKKNGLKQVMIGILSVIISVISVGYWQYNEYLKQQRKLKEEEERRAYLRQLEEMRLKETLSNLTNDIHHDTRNLIIICLLIVASLFFCFCFIKTCFCRKNIESKWKREGRNGRLSSIH